MTHRPTAPVTPRSTEHTALRPLGIDAVTITGGEWARWQRDNAERTIGHEFRWLEADGTVDNLRRLTPGASGSPERRGLLFTDSDLYKALEGVAWELGRQPDPALRDLLDDTTAILAAAQEPDGYLNSWVQAGGAERWAELDRSHEHYCIGHLIQAGIAAARAAGAPALLDVAIRAADAVDADFGDHRRTGVDGHEEIEMALVELYRETGEQRYLRLAGQFLGDRGHEQLRTRHAEPDYYQDGLPVREQTTVVGHAVRAVYLLCGMVDVYLETGERALLDAAVAQWEAMTARKTYITGALGSRFEGEAFGDDHELPPDLGYGETCATIGQVMLSWRLLLVTGEGRYADAMERGLVNLIAASTDLARTGFFYSNPAQRRTSRPASPTDTRPTRADAPGTRPPWFECACCPPNILRTISSLAAYITTATPSGLQVHQFLPARVRVTLAAGDVDLEVVTDYPVSGAVLLRILAAPGGEWELALRIPGWAGSATVAVNGTTDAGTDARGYRVFRRAWAAGDEVRLDLPVEPRLTVAHPAADALRGTVAVERGPVVYALESPDNGELDLGSVVLDADAPLTVVPADLFGRTVPVIDAAGVSATHPDWPATGYATLGSPAAEAGAVEHRVTLRFIPYALWANRGPSTMRVHVPYRKAGRA